MNIIRPYEKVKYNNNLLRPKMMSWDITRKCNMKCMHCFNNSGDSKFHDFDNELSMEEMLNVANQIVELKPEQCCLCGGETLLNKYVFDIIRILSNGNILVNIVSNGLLLTESVAKKLKTSGINNVQISVDGLGYQHDKFRNMDGAFKKAIKALTNLKKCNINSMVSFCPNTLNYKYFENYVSYMNDIGCTNIRMMPLLPLGRGKLNFSKLLLTSNQTFEFVQKLTYLRAKYPNITFEWGDPIEHLVLVLTNKNKCPNTMGILSNGDLSVTPYIPIIVGNVREKTLMEYWHGGYNKIWRNPDILNIIKKVKTVNDLESLSSFSYNFNL